MYTKKDHNKKEEQGTKKLIKFNSSIPLKRKREISKNIELFLLDFSFKKFSTNKIVVFKGDFSSLKVKTI